MEAATAILRKEAITDVAIEETDRPLGDHYDPRKKTLRLSVPSKSNTPTAREERETAIRSISAIGVAAHEAGHAIQHARGFGPLALRTTIVPVANFGSQLAFPLFFLGLILRYQPLLTAGILLFSAAVLFTLITLPVEFDASRRAVGALKGESLVSTEELGAVKEVLFAAALTYVAAAAMAALQLFLLLSAGRRR